MSLWGSIADIVTLGAYSTTKNLVEESVDWLQDVDEADDSGNSKAPRQRDGFPIRESGTTCCPKYQIEGDFLLNTNTGKVWQFDSVSNSFRGVPKKPSKGKYEIMVAEAEDLKAVLKKEIAEYVSQLDSGSRIAKEKELKEKLISPIDRYLAFMK